MSTMKMPELPDPNDSWALVELYRWQHGCLPNQPDHEEKPLSIPAALEGMASAIQKNDRRNFPTPMNVISVLRYTAKHLREQHDEVVENAIDAVKGCLVDPPTHQQDDLLRDIVEKLENLKKKSSLTEVLA